uniref:Uncharacterized protein n=1 Tax=Arundo donax TaxID=35708 RepID=A0A0A8YBD8_ARUDO
MAPNMHGSHGSNPSLSPYLSAIELRALDLRPVRLILLFLVLVAC